MVSGGGEWLPESWEDYYIPETRVLRNKLRLPGAGEQPYGITDRGKLLEVEAALSLGRLTTIDRHPELLVCESLADMQALHRHILGDVYAWAGQLRVGPAEPRRMTKKYADVVDYEPGDPTAPDRLYAYAPLSYLQQGLRQEFDKLAAANWLRGLSRTEFLPRLAETWGEINFLHPFREGNTRTQAAFFAILATRADHPFDASLFLPDAPLREPFIAARFHYQATLDSGRLTEVLAEATGHYPKPDVPAESTAAIQAVLQVAFGRPATEVADVAPPTAGELASREHASQTHDQQAGRRHDPKERE